MIIVASPSLIAQRQAGDARAGPRSGAEEQAANELILQSAQDGGGDSIRRGRVDRRHRSAASAHPAIRSVAAALHAGTYRRRGWCPASLGCFSIGQRLRHPRLADRRPGPTWLQSSNELDDRTAAASHSSSSMLLTVRRPHPSSPPSLSLHRIVLRIDFARQTTFFEAANAFSSSLARSGRPPSSDRIFHCASLDALLRGHPAELDLGHAGLRTCSG